MTTNYLDAARKGMNKWWQYVLVLAVIPAVITVFCSIVWMFLLMISGHLNLSEHPSQLLINKLLRSGSPWLNYIAFISTYSLICAGILAGMKKIHHRNFFSANHIYC
jgi:hypothetical protein